MNNFSEISKQKLIIGAKKSGSLSKQRSENLKSVYHQNPKLCKNCNEIISYEKKSNIFCSLHCAAVYNKNRKPQAKFCFNCSNQLSKSSKKYCSVKCRQEYREADSIHKWLNGQIEGGIEAGVKTWVRKYLFEQQEGKCNICGLAEWLGKPIGLIADHIDGNPNNHVRDNLRLVCANCDMQLDTYKAKNKGNGRANRSKHIKKDTIKDKINKEICACNNTKSKTSTTCIDCWSKTKIKPLIEWPSLEYLQKRYRELGCSMSALAKEIGCSDNGLKKHLLSQYGVVFSRR